MSAATKEQAVARGDSVYFTGRPCRKGHVGLRRVSGHCVTCASISQASRYEKEKSIAPDRLKEKNGLQNLRSREYQRNWEKQDRLKNPEKYVAKDRRWYGANAEKKRAYTKQWVHDNYAHVLAKNSARRALQINRQPRWLTKADKESIKQTYAQAVKISKETGVPHHVDHIVPLCGELVSGLHVPLNLRVITAFKNRSKKNSFQIV